MPVMKEGRLPQKGLPSIHFAQHERTLTGASETADKPKQRNGIRAAQTETPRDDTRLGGLLQSGGYEICH